MSLLDEIPISTPSDLYSNQTIHDNVIIGLILFELVLLSLIIVMSMTWFIYYTNHALVMRKKIYLLKYRSDSYPIDRLIDSQIDYCRSQLISAILFFSIIGYLCLIVDGVYVFEAPVKILRHNCTLTRPFTLAYESSAYRILLSPSSLISSYITLSLIVILTSYLHKAYSSSRVIIITENNLFVWMCIEVGIVFLVNMTWWSFILFNPIIITLLGIIKLYLLLKYTNRLLHALKKRFGSAINEAQKQLEVGKQRLHMRYLLGARSFFIYCVFYITTNGVVTISERFRLLVTSECVLTMLFGPNLQFRYIDWSEPHWWKLFFRICIISQSMLYIILLLLLFVLHLGLFRILIFQLARAICCRHKQKKKNRVTFAHDHITKPLLSPN